MAKLVALRIPDDLIEKIDTRCVIRKVNRTDVILGALRDSFTADVAQPDRAEPSKFQDAGSTPASRSNPLDIPGVKRGAEFFSKPADLDFPVEIPQCSYTEWSGELGEKLRCTLPTDPPHRRHKL